MDKSVIIEQQSINKSDLEKELECFKLAELIIKEEDVEEFDQLGAIYFYKINYRKYHILTEIAKAILCTPKTSVPSECLFSREGQIQNETRNRLHPETLNFNIHKRK